MDGVHMDPIARQRD